MALFHPTVDTQATLIPVAIKFHMGQPPRSLTPVSTGPRLKKPRLPQSMNICPIQDLAKKISLANSG